MPLVCLITVFIYCQRLNLFFYSPHKTHAKPIKTFTFFAGIAFLQSCQILEKPVKQKQPRGLNNRAAVKNILLFAALVKFIQLYGIINSFFFSLVTVTIDVLHVFRSVIQTQRSVKTASVAGHALEEIMHGFIEL